MSNQNDTVLCNECGQRINATTNWCTPCNAKHFESNFQNWTSGSVELDEFIRKTQLTAERHECIFEWVDYSKFSLLEKVEHSKNHRAYWEEGPLLGWNTKSNEWTRNGGQWVKLITNFCGEKYYASRFLKSEYEASKSNPSKRLVYGMTRNPVTNDYAVIERLIDRCPDCHKEWMSLRWCRGCNPKHFESERHKWTSGNSEIDDFILETQITAEFSDQALEWIPETQLTEFKLIGKGGFGTVFKAKWKEGRIYKWDSIANKWKRGESMWVALKSVEKGEEDVKEFLEEIKAMHQCRKVNLGSLDCYGVTRHPDTKKYLMVIRFVEFGDLRNYLSNFATNSWKDLLDRLWSLTIDLRSLHRSGLVHRDLHSGNVLFGDNRRNFVADLGLACKDGQNITGEIKGVLPYVAPEILRRQPHTKASDIYSFGIIMWELTSPQPPFYETAYDFHLALSICDGKRPQVIKGTPACYVELMKKCWDPNPSKRPTAQEMAEIFKEWTQILSKDELNEEEKSIKDQFVSSDLERQRSSRPTITFRELSTRPLTSCRLPTVSLSDLQYQTTQYDLKITNDLPYNT